MKKHKKEELEALEAELAAEAAAAGETMAEIPETDEELELLKVENARLKEDYLRSLADAENIKKRCTQEIEKNQKYAISSFAKELLSVADNLERALQAESKCETLRKGVELTLEGLKKVFHKFGIKKMETLDTVFDPHFHQVIQEVEDKEKKPGTVISELQTGYMINDRILREAMVVVSKR